MNKLIIGLTAMVLIFSLAGCMRSKDPSEWTSKRIAKWFENEDWLNGWNVKPDKSVNHKEFVLSYFRNKERWNKAFTFLKSNDLPKMELKRYDIEGDNLYATVSEYLSKDEENARYERHHKYIDIQYVVTGAELIGLGSMDQIRNVTEPYDPIKDIEFLNLDNGVNHEAKPDRFFIFFPSNPHMPGIKSGEQSIVRKVVIKVRTE